MGEAFCLFLVASEMFSSCSLLQSKGYAIGNAPELAKAHNSHARWVRGLSQLTSAGRGRLSTELSSPLPLQAGATALAGKAERDQRCANHGGFSFCQLCPHQGTAV